MVDFIYVGEEESDGLSEVETSRAVARLLG